MPRNKSKSILCDHDYKNSIPYGNVDHICLKCKEFIDPLEWWLCTNFDIVDCTPKEEMKRLERNLKKHIEDEEKYIQSFK